jgi:hypothetical protein
MYYYLCDVMYGCDLPSVIHSVRIATDPGTIAKVHGFGSSSPKIRGITAEGSVQRPGEGEERSSHASSSIEFNSSIRLLGLEHL